MKKTLHSKDYVDRMYVSRKEERRELASIHDIIDVSIQQLKNYIKSTEEDWL